MRSFEQERKNIKSYIYPSNLEKVILDIKKIEDKYNLRPRQISSIINFYYQHNQLEDEHLRLLTEHKTHRKR